MVQQIKGDADIFSNMTVRDLRNNNAANNFEHTIVKQETLNPEKPTCLSIKTRNRPNYAVLFTFDRKSNAVPCLDIKKFP